MSPSTSLHAGSLPETARMPTTAFNMLQPVIDCLQGTLPGIRVQVGSASPRQIMTCEAQQPPVRELVAYLRHAHPEAGPHYWSARAYTLLVWQPAYFAVLSVHLAGVMPHLQGMGQECHNGFVWGATLPPAPPYSASPEAMIRKAGGMIMQTSQALSCSLAHDISIHPKLAGRLLADHMMAALLVVQQQRPGLRNAVIRTLSQEWLQAANLQGCSGLIPVGLDDGREQLVLERRACCQHFRRHDGGLCSTCPKLKPADRLCMIRRELARPKP